jgi:hypothetical protein
LERMASIDASVDWMRFWLLGEEDSSPEKYQRFRYWRQLREATELGKGKE